MAQFDLPLEALREYRANVPVPDDFDDFWRDTLATSRAAWWEPTRDPVNCGLEVVEVSDVRFAGFAGEPVSAWWTLPGGREPRAVIVHLVGYSGGRGAPFDVSPFPLAGYAQLTVDTRGQGWRTDNFGGSTPDPHGAASAVPGVMTRGIEHRDTYYYRRAFTDAVLAVDAARALAPGLPVIVAGGSQGGGFTIAAAAFSEGLAGAMPDVPFLCDFPRATTMFDSMPYGEIREYLVHHRGEEERVAETLQYFDGTTLAQRATAPALFSVALMDAICPPSTVFAAYNVWGSAEKSIEVYPFNNHEGGGAHQRRRQLEWLAERV